MENMILHIMVSIEGSFHAKKTVDLKPGCLDIIL